MLKLIQSQYSWRKVWTYFHLFFLYSKVRWNKQVLTGFMTKDSYSGKEVACEFPEWLLSEGGCWGQVRLQQCKHDNGPQRRDISLRKIKNIYANYTYIYVKRIHTFFSFIFVYFRGWYFHVYCQIAKYARTVKFWIITRKFKRCYSSFCRGSGSRWSVY